MLINKKMINLFGCLVWVCFFLSPKLLQANDNTIDDAKITIQAKTKLFVEKGVPSTEISIKTHDGVVFLNGTLHSELQATAAVEAVESIEGVKDVNVYNLKIRGSKKPLTDSYITAKVKGMFLRKAFTEDQSVSAMDIMVETKNGIVYLKGWVSDQRTENNAITMAKQIKGVNKVISFIKVK
jgi:hyperosmotically inducible protein